MSSTLLHAHSQLVTLDQLRALPAPVARGERHKPVPFATLVDGLQGEANRQGYLVIGTQLAIGKGGSKLFGTMDLQLKTALADAESAMSLAFRGSTDSSIALKGAAGRHIMICDNMSLHGDMDSWLKKSTIHLNLQAMIAGGFAKFVKQASALDLQIAMLQAKQISDIQARAVAFTLFENNVVPVKLLTTVTTNYFHPQDEWSDVTPRTMYGLQNAFTRATQTLSPAARFDADVRIGKAFQVPMLEGEIVS